jgi:hypothetical protein
MEKCSGESFILAILDGAVVDAHAVSHLAAEELVDGESGCLAGHVPEGHLDRADGAAPWLEAAAGTDLAHDALDVGRVVTDEGRLQMEDMPGQVRLVGLDAAVAADALVSDDAHDRVVAENGALEIDDLHGVRASLLGRATRRKTGGVADWVCHESYQARASDGAGFVAARTDYDRILRRVKSDVGCFQSREECA